MMSYWKLLVGCLILYGVTCARAEDTGPVALAPIGRWGNSAASSRSNLGRSSPADDERRAHRLTSLVLSPELQVAARQHCHEMVEKGYFDHASPMATWRMPWQRSYCAGFWGYQVGENLLDISDSVVNLDYPNRLASQCVKMWMDSPAHRENILEEKWTLTGVGAVQSGTTVYCTQLFAVPLVTLERAAVSAVAGELVQCRINGTLPPAQ